MSNPAPELPAAKRVIVAFDRVKIVPEARSMNRKSRSPRQFDFASIDGSRLDSANAIEIR